MRLERLDAENLSVCIAPGESSLQVNVRVQEHVPVDRRDLWGWSVPLNRRDLAERLMRAILAGVVFTDACVRRDVNGKTYVSASARVIGRRMHADLRRLGF